ncbi:MAG: cytochrome c maturation protein CcmE [Nitrospiraceae bacterium]|nr:MAG: cytochrome c maturation protein CcmE [Nitrospiraceae bacterium]
MKGKTKVIIISLVIIAAFLYLVLIGMKEGTMYYLEVGEFINKMDEIGQLKVRVNGEIVAKSLDYDTKSLVLAFSLKDIKGPQVLNVHYKGTPPDLIEQEGVTLVAEGSYNRNKNVFVAKQLLVKCPSKYEKKDAYEKKDGKV